MDIERFYKTLLAPSDDSGADGQDTPDTEGKDTQEEPGNDQKMFPADYVSKLRDENKSYRLKAKELESDLERLKQLESKVKGIFGEEEDDPAKRLAALEEENKMLKLDKVISSASKKHNADPDLIGAYLLHKGIINPDMEPDAIEAEIKKAVESNPRLKAELPKAVGDGKPASNGSGKVSMNDFIRSAAGR